MRILETKADYATFAKEFLPPAGDGKSYTDKAAKIAELLKTQDFGCPRTEITELMTAVCDHIGIELPPIKVDDTLIKPGMVVRLKTSAVIFHHSVASDFPIVMAMPDKHFLRVDGRPTARERAEATLDKEYYTLASAEDIDKFFEALPEDALAKL
jgi:hypothetical protein